MEIKVSVIIPVFNPGERMQKCISSLLEQSLKEIEIILIDDVCTDGTSEYIKACAQKDPRIRLLTNTSNIGPGRSRNRGIEAARGEYLSFVDADDYVSPDFLDNLYSEAVTSDADVAKGILCFINLRGECSTEKSFALNAKILKRMKSGQPVYPIYITEHQAAVYRRDMVISNKIFYGTSGNAEDEFFLMQICCATDKIQITNKGVYYYVEREGSRFRDISLKRVGEEILSLKEMMRFMASRDMHSAEDLRYIAGQEMAALGFINVMMEKEKNSGELIDMQTELRSLITQYPWAEEINDAYLIVRAFLTDDLNLAPPHVMTPEVPYEFLYRNALEWIRYLSIHPSYMGLGAWFLNNAVKQVALSPGARRETKDRLSSLRSQASRLPYNDPALKNYQKLRVLIRTGLNLYGIGNTRAGKLFSRFLKRRREMKSRESYHP